VAPDPPAELRTQARAIEDSMWMGRDLPKSPHQTLFWLGWHCRGASIRGSRDGISRGFDDVSLAELGFSSTWRRVVGELARQPQEP
jgi:hypothetical protein